MIPIGSHRERVRHREVPGATPFWHKGGCFNRNVRSGAEFAREVLYIHRDPVERGQVKTPPERPSSGGRW